jgi:hypothetical protein
MVLAIRKPSVSQMNIARRRYYQCIGKGKQAFWSEVQTTPTGQACFPSGNGSPDTIGPDPCGICLNGGKCSAAGTVCSFPLFVRTSFVLGTAVTLCFCV